MRVYVVDTFTWERDRSNVFHYCMFHGEEIPRERGVHSTAHFLGSDLSHPMVIMRNAHRVPDVFAPGTTLIVSSEVKKKLERLPNVGFLQVIFKKLVDCPYHVGDFSYFETPEYLRDPEKCDPEKLIQRLPDVPELHGKIGPYYELLVPRLRDVKSKYVNLKAVSCRFPRSWEFSAELSDEMMSHYPIIWAKSNVLSERAFEILSPHLDRDYFDVAEVEL